jgi:hypothetical protein
MKPQNRSTRDTARNVEDGAIPEQGRQLQR